MSLYLQEKLDNLNRILRTIGDGPKASGSRPDPVPPDGSFHGKPLLLWLESTARCNLRCPKCSHGFEPGTPRTLPRNLADAVVDEADPYFAAAVKVRTSGYGEMFLFNRLRQFVERLKKYECWTEGTTNAVMIDRSEVDWLVELGYDQLVVSIDGVEPETMQRLRGADIHKIWEVLSYIKQKKDELGSSKPRIIVGFVAQSDNIAELPALVRKLSELDICFLAVNTLHYKKYDPGTEHPYARLCHDFSLARLDRKYVAGILAEAQALAEQANIGYGPYIDLDRVYRENTDPDDEDEQADLVTIDSSRAATPIEPLEPFYCVYPWTSFYVTARGAASICCAMQGEVGTVLGSGDMDRVWNGETLRAIRTAVSRGEVHPFCTHCVTRARYKDSLVELEEAKEALAARLPVPSGTGEPKAPLPAEPIFGFVDTRDLQAHSGGRIRFAGWMASRRPEAPVREVSIRLNDRELGKVRRFHPRPDVAAYFGYPHLVDSGWQAVIDLPPLAPGSYNLVVEGTDAEGISAALEPLAVSIVE